MRAITCILWIRPDKRFPILREIPSTHTRKDGDTDVSKNIVSINFLF